MKYYIVNSELRAIESDGSQDHLIRPDWVGISEQEKDVILTVTLTDEEKFSAAVTQLSRLYDAAMSQARNGYTQEEVNTFSSKIASAKAILGGTSDALDRVTVAKLEGLINGVLPASISEIEALDAAFTEGQISEIQSRAIKISKADITYRLIGGEIERLRNIRYDEIVAGADADAVVSALESDYIELANRLL